LKTELNESRGSEKSCQNRITKLTAEVQLTGSNLTWARKEKARISKVFDELEEKFKLSQTVLNTLALIRIRLVLKSEEANDSRVEAGNDVAHLGKLPLDVILCFLGIYSESDQRRLERMYAFDFTAYLGSFDNLYPLFQSPLPLEPQMVEMRGSLASLLSRTLEPALHHEFIEKRAALTRGLKAATDSSENTKEARAASTTSPETTTTLRRLREIFDTVRESHRRRGRA
jgi:hypothetical protein